MTTKKRTTKRTPLKIKKTNKKKTAAKKKPVNKKKKPAVKPPTMARKPTWVTDLFSNIRRILHFNAVTAKGISDIATAIKMLAESNQKTLQALNVFADSVNAASGKTANLKPVAQVKTKAQTTAMLDTVTNAVESETQETETQDTETSETETVTKEQVKQALQEVSSKFGLPKVHELLKEFDSKNVTGIKETDYPNFYKACVDMTAPNATV